MSHSVVDDSEVIIGHQEEIAGAMEREGSLQNRGEKESWLADTEPYRGARPRMRDFDRLVDEELGATAGEVEDSGHSPTMVLEETVGRLQRDLEELQLENRFLKTPKAVKSVPLVRQAAFTTTKVPWFDGSTSWEQYLQVFEAIVLSNGWGDATAALQLLSHLQGDALTLSLARATKVAHYDVTLYWHGRLKSPKLCDVDYVDICVTWRLPYSNETNKILLFY